MRGESISLARRAAATAKKRREEARAELERQGVREDVESALEGLVGASASTRANVSQNKVKRIKRVKWSQEEVDALRAGVARYGEGRWAVILREFAASFNDVRISVDLKDKWRNLYKAHRADASHIVSASAPADASVPDDISRGAALMASGAAEMRRIAARSVYVPPASHQSGHGPHADATDGTRPPAEQVHVSDVRALPVEGMHPDTIADAGSMHEGEHRHHQLVRDISQHDGLHSTSMPQASHDGLPQQVPEAVHSVPDEQMYEGVEQMHDSHFQVSHPAALDGEARVTVTDGLQQEVEHEGQVSTMHGLDHVQQVHMTCVSPDTLPSVHGQHAQQHMHVGHDGQGDIQVDHAQEHMHVEHGEIPGEHGERDMLVHNTQQRVHVEHEGEMPGENGEDSVQVEHVQELPYGQTAEEGVPESDMAGQAGDVANGGEVEYEGNDNTATAHEDTNMQERQANVVHVDEADNESRAAEQTGVAPVEMVEEADEMGDSVTEQEQVIQEEHQFDSHETQEHLVSLKLPTSNTEIEIQVRQENPESDVRRNQRDNDIEVQEQLSNHEGDVDNADVNEERTNIEQPLGEHVQKQLSNHEEDVGNADVNEERTNVEQPLGEHVQEERAHEEHVHGEHAPDEDMHREHIRDLHLHGENAQREIADGGLMHGEPIKNEPLPDEVREHTDVQHVQSESSHSQYLLDERTSGEHTRNDVVVGERYANEENRRDVVPLCSEEQGENAHVGEKQGQEAQVGDAHMGDVPLET